MDALPGLPDPDGDLSAEGLLFRAAGELTLARLQRASEREGLRPDTDHDLLIDQISGPIYYRALITGAATDRSYAERLVRAVLDGAITARARAG